MSDHFQRALLLMQQSRTELAEKELRQTLLQDPDHARAHGLLAMCLAVREQFREALQEGGQAVHLAPDDPFTHYALAGVLSQSNRLEEAEQAIAESLRLDPTDADYSAKLAEIRFQQRRWQDALQAAEQGLRCDPQHTTCVNLRAMSLVKLGKKDAAGAALDSVLRRDPENALTHTNQGWRYLEQGDHQKALEHFREALRIDPEMDSARHGILESLKARHFVYRMMLGYFLWMMKLSRQAQWGILIGGYFGYRVLLAIARDNAALRPWVMPLVVLYVAFAIMTWISSPLFNLLLRLNRFGRLVLSRDEIVTSNWVGLCVVGALGSLLLYFVAGADAALVSALVCGLLIPPLSTIYHCDPGWPRTTAVLVAAGLAVLGLGAATLAWMSSVLAGQAAETTRALGGVLLAPFLLGAIGYQFAAHALVNARPRK